MSTLTVRHIGPVTPICGAKSKRIDHFRSDLTTDRYRQLGVVERFKNEAPYRVCKNCIRCHETGNWLFKKRAH